MQIPYIQTLLHGDQIPREIEIEGVDLVMQAQRLQKAKCKFEARISLRGVFMDIVGNSGVVDETLPSDKGMNTPTSRTKNIRRAWVAVRKAFIETDAGLGEGRFLLKERTRSCSLLTKAQSRYMGMWNLKTKISISCGLNIRLGTVERPILVNPKPLKSEMHSISLSTHNNTHAPADENRSGLVLLPGIHDLLCSDDDLGVVSKEAARLMLQPGRLGLRWWHIYDTTVGKILTGTKDQAYSADDLTLEQGAIE